MEFLNLARSEDAVDATVDILQLTFGGILGFGIGIIVVFIIQGIVRHALRRRPAFFDSIRPAARPLQLALGVLGAWLAISYMLRAQRPEWHANALHGFIILEIIAVTWLITSIVGAVEHIILNSVRENSQSRYRKVQTQMQILQRVITVVIWVCGFAAVLLTFPDARTLGTSLLASAGILSVVAGVAAQSTLSNMFAGLQLAFSDSIRVGDVVFWENERCAVEEITLTYVVLRVWDGRRLIVPSSTMTTTTFANWTRRSSEIIEHVNFRLDWSAPIPEMREYLGVLLKATDLWDGRLGVLQVRDTDSEFIQVSALVSAKNSSTMLDLRSYLREEMVTWLQSNHPEALPHNRYFNYNFEETDRPGGRENKTQELSLVAPVEKAEKKKVRDISEVSEKNTAQGAQQSAMSAQDAQETAVLSLEERGLSADQPERVPIAQRDISDTTVLETRHGHESSVFTGSVEAEARAEDFESAGAAAAAERAEAARKRSQAEAEAEREAQAREEKHQAKKTKKERE